MVSAAELLGLFALVAGVGYWAGAMRSQEHARQAAGQACRQQDVQLLDDTVALTRIRLRRDSGGRVVLQRDYRFEYTPDGDTRYGGSVRLFGGRVVQVALDPDSKSPPPFSPG